MLDVGEGIYSTARAGYARLPHWRFALALALLGLIFLVPRAAGVAAAASQQTAAAGQTVVSLTFDDGTATQYLARAQLASHGMHGTFYVNSSQAGDRQLLHDLGAGSRHRRGRATRSAAIPPTTSTSRRPTRPKRSGRSATTGSTCSIGASVKTLPIPTAPTTRAPRHLSRAAATTRHERPPGSAPPGRVDPAGDPYAIRIAGSGPRGHAAGRSRAM